MKQNTSTTAALEGDYTVSGDVVREVTDIENGQASLKVVEVIDRKSVYDEGDVETPPVEVVNDGSYGIVVSRDEIESVDVENGDTLKWGDGTTTVSVENDMIELEDAPRFAPDSLGSMLQLKINIATDNAEVLG